MTASNEDLWKRFQQSATYFPIIGLAGHFNRMNLVGNLPATEIRIQKAFVAVEELKKAISPTPMRCRWLTTIGNDKVFQNILILSYKAGLERVSKCHQQVVMRSSDKRTVLFDGNKSESSNCGL